jgi:enoyl-CoA hydratase/carnithine racemase
LRALEVAASLEVAQDGGVWTLTLSRPEKRNALSAELVERLSDAVARAHAGAARVLVFRGEGKNFSAGFDFSGVEGESEGDLLLRFVRIEELLQAVAASPCLTVGLAHGRNFGAGVDLLAACRVRVAAADATFRMPGLRFGLVLGTRRFAAIVGGERARRILEAASTFDAGEAQEMGFVHRIVERDGWPEAIGAAGETAAPSALDDVTRASLYRVLSRADDNADLADLVRSAARPGLKARIAAYLGAN